MNNLFKITKRRFCLGSPTHHDYHKEKDVEQIYYLVFEYLRVIFYMALGFKLIQHAPNLIAFRKKHFLNNPDYMIADEKDFAAFSHHTPKEPTMKLI